MPQTELYYCFDITLNEGTKHYRTNHPDGLMLADRQYLPCGSFTLEQLDVHRLDHTRIIGLLDTDLLTPAQWLQAQMTIQSVDLLEDPPRIRQILDGVVASVEYSQGHIELSIAPITHRLQQDLIQHYSTSCRAVFGDNRCRVDRLARSQTAHIAQRLGEGGYELDAVPEHPILGALQLEDGRQRAIIQHHKAKIWLDAAFDMPLDPGTEVRLLPGCSKQFHQCVGLYDNALNFQGEPHIPTVASLQPD